MAPAIKKDTRVKLSRHFNFRITKDITYNDYNMICDRLSIVLNHRIVVDRITEGGFKFKDNNDFVCYKTMRAHVHQKGPRGEQQNIRFPWIDETLGTSQWYNNTTILWRKDSYGWMNAKTNGTAPEWNDAELRKFKIVLREFGFKCR